jgi:hypothetical protein
MLDAFLTVAYGKTKQAQAMDQRVQLMRKLSNNTLVKIANGKMKLGHAHLVGEDEGNWLDRFKDTPLFQDALEVEKQELENRIVERQRSQEQDERWRAQSDARDDLCIRRKMLELRLAELESGTSEEAADEGAAEAMGGNQLQKEDSAPDETQFVPASQGGETPPAEEAPSKEAHVLLAARMKTAAMKLGMEDKTKQLLTAAAIPVASGLTGAAIYGLGGTGRAGAPTLGRRLKIGGTYGAAAGAAVTGLIGLGALLEKADPSGKSLETIVRLAPAAAATAGAIADMRREEERRKSASVKMATTLAELEEETRRQGREAGSKWGRKKGAISGGASGARLGTVGGTLSGALVGLKGGGGLKGHLARAAIGAAIGGGGGAAAGGAAGAHKGKQIGSAMGEQAAEEMNYRRRMMIANALQQQAEEAGQAKAAMSKEAIGLWGAGKGLFSAMRTGWKGVGAAGKKGISGVGGATHHGSEYMKGLYRKAPGTASGLTAVGVGVPALGAGYMMGD